MNEKISIKLSRDIVQKISQLVNDSEEFQSVEEFVEFVLNEVMKDEEAESVYSPEEEGIIKNRLKSLGYI